MDEGNGFMAERIKNLTEEYEHLNRNFMVTKEHNQKLRKAIAHIESVQNLVNLIVQSLPDIKTSIDRLLTKCPLIVQNTESKSSTEYNLSQKGSNPFSNERSSKTELRNHIEVNYGDHSPCLRVELERLPTTVMEAKLRKHLK